jgi:hypothetical protein
MKNFWVRAVLPAANDTFDLVSEPVKASGYQINEHRDLCFYTMEDGRKMNTATFKEMYWLYVIEANDG